jgi:hypothetical protein
VKLRGLPGALAFGLLASFFAHAAVYGHEHAMGGAYHELLRSMALAAVGGFAMAFGALAWFGAGPCSDGSVLAARLAGHLPSLPLLAAAGFGWFVLGESIEGTHPDASAILIAAALLVVSWLLLAGLRALLRLVAAIVVAILTIEFAPRLEQWSAHFALPPIARETLHRFRLFARPPPSARARA